MTETLLDAAHAAMDNGDDAARLRFFERLADAELFLLLAEEATGDSLTPETFEVADGTFVLVFDLEERLGEFVGQPAPYAALSGRAIASMLAGQGIGLGLNLEVAPSSMLVPSEALGWLQETLGHRPQQVEARPTDLSAPANLPKALLQALDAKFASMTGLADAAYLVAVTYAGGRKGYLLGFVGGAPAAESALAGAVGEALTFSGIEAGELDVGFFQATDPMATALAGVGLRFDLPQPQPATVPGAPGMDPEAPPKLR